MTLADELKILDDKIKENQAQYDLDREAAKISALSSGELEKYKYLTGEDLGYQPEKVKKPKSEYSQLKRLKDIEGKNKEQVNRIKYQGQKQLDAIKKQRKKHLEEINRQEKQLK